MQGVEKKIAYKTFTEVDFDVSCNPSAEQGVYKVRDAWLKKLSA